MIKNKVKRAGAIMCAMAMVYSTGVTAYAAEKSVDVVNMESIQIAGKNAGDKQQFEVTYLDETGKKVKVSNAALITKAIKVNGKNESVSFEFTDVKPINSTGAETVKLTKLVGVGETVNAVSVKEGKVSK